MNWLPFVLANRLLTHYVVDPASDSSIWDVLVLNIDQGSDGWSAQYFLRYGLCACVLVLIDPAHRSWKNSKLALQDAGLWGVVTVTIACLNGDQ